MNAMSDSTIAARQEAPVSVKDHEPVARAGSRSEDLTKARPFHWLAGRRAMTVSALGAVLALGACATTGAPGPLAPVPAAGNASILVSVGPCFGFCPVYDVAIASGDTVIFAGKRHTAVLGDRSRQVPAETFRKVAADLAPFRPTTGTEAEVPCETQITDTSVYTITWIDVDGQRTVARHQSRCSGGPGRALDAVLGSLPERLGIADWAKQTIREGASRG
jgi:hypothetical protein